MLGLEDDTVTGDKERELTPLSLESVQMGFESSGHFGRDMW